MKTLISIGLLSLSMSVQAVKVCNNDSFTPEGDKIAHLTYSIGIGAASRVVIKDPWVAFGASLLPGFYREVFRGECFSAEDMVYNAIGSAIGVTGVNFILSKDKVLYSINLNIF
jgi:hypothetical protein